MRRKILASLLLIGEATLVVVRQLPVLFYAGFLPIVAIFMLSAITLPVKHIIGLRIVLALAALPFYVMFATTVHRVVILGRNGLPSRSGIFWTERETRFLGWFIGLWFVYFAVALSVGLVLYGLTSIASGTTLSWLALFLTYFVAAYYQGRLGLVLPATAVDKHLDYTQAWDISRGKGIMIAIAIFVPGMLLVAAEYVLAAGTDEALSPFVDFIWTLLTIPVFAIEIAIISRAYVKLTD